MDTVRLELRRVRGPGSFSLFTFNPFGAPEVKLNSRDGLPDRLSLPVATHQHANWGFTEAGTYRLTVQVTATRTDATTVRSAPVVLTFRVHP